MYVVQVPPLLRYNVLNVQYLQFTFMTPFFTVGVEDAVFKFCIVPVNWLLLILFPFFSISFYFLVLLVEQIACLVRFIRMRALSFYFL